MTGRMTNGVKINRIADQAFSKMEGGGSKKFLSDKGAFPSKSSKSISIEEIV